MPPRRLGASGFGSSASNTIYNAFVKPKPGNLPSEAFEAQSVSQFGDKVTFAASANKKRTGPNGGEWYQPGVGCWTGYNPAVQFTASRH